jgi:hypothetical protein
MDIGRKTKAKLIERGKRTMSHVDFIRKGLDREQVNGLTVVPNCPEDCEGYFSWYPCELCRDHKGGNRHHAALIKAGTKQEPIGLEICECCLLYVANGDVCRCED